MKNQTTNSTLLIPVWRLSALESTAVPACIVHKLDMLAEDQPLKRWMSQNARQRAIEHGSLKAYQDRMISTLHSVVAGL